MCCHSRLCSRDVWVGLSLRTSKPAGEKLARPWIRRITKVAVSIVAAVAFLLPLVLVVAPPAALTSLATRVAKLLPRGPRPDRGVHPIDLALHLLPPLPGFAPTDACALARVVR